MFTANSMNCLCEVLGIALPGNGTIPAVYSARMQLAKKAGMAIMDMVEKDIKPRDIINEQALRNGLACDMALGLSLIHIYGMILGDDGETIDLQGFFHF